MTDATDNKSKCELLENCISEENSNNEEKLENTKKDQAAESNKTNKSLKKDEILMKEHNHNESNDESNYNKKKNPGSSNTLCFLCRKYKSKKKGKNRTRLRKLPTKLSNLSEASLKILKDEFKLNDEFKIQTEDKYRYCNLCFKNFLTRISELDSINAKISNNMKTANIGDKQHSILTDFEEDISDEDYDDCLTDDSFDSEAAERNFETSKLFIEIISGL